MTVPTGQHQTYRSGIPFLGALWISVALFSEGLTTIPGSGWVINARVRNFGNSLIYEDLYKIIRAPNRDYLAAGGGKKNKLFSIR